MLLLFQLEGCPYCQKVKNALKNMKLECTYLPNELNGKIHPMLEKLGGEDQIPFLVDTDTGEMMYESDDIVEYLEKNYGGK
jgi:glutathione S-transferase